jgi:hypothetical protein
MIIPDELLTAIGLDDAFIGHIERMNEPPVAVYDREKIIQIFMTRDGMTWEEAEEFFEFNVGGAYMGPQTPAYLIRPEEE